MVGRVLIGLALLGVAVWALSSSAGADATVTVTPKVTVDPSGSLSIYSGAPEGMIEFGHMAAGQTLTNTLTLRVTANDDWDLSVEKSQDLFCSQLEDPGYNENIPSSSFTYTSNGAMGGVYAVTDTEFGDSVTPSSVVDDGSAVSDGDVSVVYKLNIPGDQLAGYYAAPVHTYTLVVGS